MFKVRIAPMFGIFALNFLVPALLHGQTPAFCAIVVQKSCTDEYGDYQDHGPYFCEDVPCVNEEFCTEGENVVVYLPFHTEENWNLKRNALVHTPPSQWGSWWDGTLMTCAMRDICEYECLFRPGHGNRCQSMSWTSQDLLLANTNHGPACQGLVE